MRYQRSTSYLIVLFVLVLTGLVYFNRGILFNMNLILVVGITLLSIFLNWRQLFIVVLSTILIVGFGLILITDQSIRGQYYLITEHILLSSSLILVWVIMTMIKFMENKMAEQDELIKSLKKYQGSSKVLEIEEFKSRVNIIMRSTTRRQTSNMLIEFKINTPKLTEKSMRNLLSQAIEQTIREDYDLVTQKTDNQFLVFLQETTEIGVEKVKERLFEKLRHQLNEITIPITCAYLEAKDYDFEKLEPKDGYISC